jgi:hypothetical protein
MRPDLRQAFDLTVAEGRRRLYWWYFIHGFREMWLDFQPSEDWKGPAAKPVEHLPMRTPIAVTWLMREIWVSNAAAGVRVTPSNALWRFGRTIRGFLQGRPEPESAREQWHLISWYFCRGLHELHLEGLLTQQQADELTSPGKSGNGTPLILTLIHRIADDLHNRFPNPSSNQWLEWCAGEGGHRFPVLAHPMISSRIFGPTREKAARAKVRDRGLCGVNLIGHAGTRSGVGEDLRMAASALAAAQIPFVVRNAPPSSGVPSEEPGLEPHLADHSPFTINLICMAGMETVTMLASRRDLLDGKLNVGFWPWELPKWPELWSHAPGLMDELWASTNFTASAYRYSTSVPVRQVPMAVDVVDTNSLTRIDFELPKNSFLFGYAFDGNSSFSRKNPEASIEAFQRAFPVGDEPVGLVLKGLRVTDHPSWQTLRRLADQDPRIVLICTSMARGELLDLFRSFDCFVSLHRSEGFGRNIAECMLLGKPVIVTNYSGNTDFTKPDTAALVDAKLKPLAEGEYPFGLGQVWADPDVNQAAAHMRRIFLDEQWRLRIGEAGQSYIRRNYCPDVVGQRFRQELSRLGQATLGD